MFEVKGLIPSRWPVEILIGWQLLIVLPISLAIALSNTAPSSTKLLRGLALLALVFSLVIVLDLSVSHGTSGLFFEIRFSSSDALLNPNTYGGFGAVLCLLGIFILFGKKLMGDRWIIKIIITSCLVFLGILLLISSGSRSPFIALLVASLVYMLIQSKNKILAIASFSIFIALIVAIGKINLIGPDVTDYLDRLFRVGVDSSSSARLEY